MPRLLCPLRGVVSCARGPNDDWRARASYLLLLPTVSQRPRHCTAATRRSDAQQVSRGALVDPPRLAQLDTLTVAGTIASHYARRQAGIGWSVGVGSDEACCLPRRGSVEHWRRMLRGFFAVMVQRWGGTEGMGPTKLIVRLPSAVGGTLARLCMPLTRHYLLTRAAACLPVFVEGGDGHVACDHHAHDL